MSNKKHTKSCQETVAAVESSLRPFETHFSRLLIHRNIARSLTLKLSKEQKALFAAHWNNLGMRKFVILDTKPKQSQSFLAAITAWSNLFHTTHRWHLISSHLTEQELSGQVLTSLCADMHSLLTSSTPTDHFVLPLSALLKPPPNAAKYKSEHLSLTVGEQIAPKQMIRRLTELGYTRYARAAEPGGFIVQGENITIGHPYTASKYTITFYYNTVERLLQQDKRGLPSNHISLPPVGFPRVSTSWSHLFKSGILIRPAHLTRFKGNYTVIDDALHPINVFPLQEHKLTPRSSSRGKVYILYRNLDRVRQATRARQLSTVALCQSSVADVHVCLKYNSTILVSERALFPQRHSTTSPISYERGLGLLHALKLERPAVHSDHGIGIYEGLQRRTIDSIEREYLVLRYAGGDALSVPVEFAHKVTAYLGEAAPVISRLGEAGWRRTRQKAHHSALLLARELMRLARKRSYAERPRYALDPVTDDILNRNFPFTLTSDQEQAWRDVRRDLGSLKPMDRLIVGDVGFGKTEIAVRAAYAAHANGKQTALLAPTTLLVQQHLDTLRSRLPQLANNIGLLSRFATNHEKQHVKDNIAAGTLSIVVGTHALLSPAIKWKNLGLVIVDEEQRFGVRQKEYLKKARASLDIMSLSATPIPRTLHMALSGLKALSTITTPPIGRQDTDTHIARDDDDTIIKAVRNELSRGGQVYAVAPRIGKLNSIQKRLQTLIPQARLAQAHGQMADRTLALTMHKFDAHEIDILVCSSIIESGLDLPNANTMIVFNAPHFGLADLYQLRGRVGRRRRQGHVYFLYSQHELTFAQRQRLAALTEASRLGSGWNLAQRDLEMRGAGNLLGAEQSGAIQSVGLQMYLDLVHQAVASEQGALVSTRDVDIVLPLTSTIPAHYIANLDERTHWYQRLTRAATTRQLRCEEQKIQHAYGRLPAQTRNLLLVLQLHICAAGLGITKITSATITPPSRQAYCRLEISSQHPDLVMPALAGVGPWQMRGETITLDAEEITPALLKKVIKACLRHSPVKTAKQTTT